MLGGKERVRIFFELPLLADFGASENGPNELAAVAHGDGCGHEAFGRVAEEANFVAVASAEEHEHFSIAVAASVENVQDGTWLREREIVVESVWNGYPAARHVSFFEWLSGCGGADVQPELGHKLGTLVDPPSRG